MEFKTVLVDLTDDDARDARLDAALTLAAWFEGRVVGLTATGPQLDPFRSAGEEMLRYQAMRADMLRGLDVAGTQALSRAVARQDASVETSHTVVDQEAGWALATHGMTSDVILPALPGGVQDVPLLLASAAEYALLNSGRPVLIVPPRHRLLPLDTAVVAWNGRREAARAVADALPLLRRAALVVVEHISTRGGAEPGASAVVRWLAGHGIDAVLELRQASSAAECLLETVVARSAGLLVAGGYGHSRIGEMVAGGTTRTLLRNAPVALLMSH
nr:universal stress protein [uncultured Cupriavidus sp.]